MGWMQAYQNTKHGSGEYRKIASNAENVQLTSNTVSIQYSRATDTIEALYTSNINI